ncbi:MAG: DUF2029 domain-containing protein [Agarilytica sp.]
MTNNETAMQFFSKRAEAVLAVLGVLGALVFLTLFGILGLFRSGSLGFDFVVFHDAGVLFLKGVNPWLASIDSGAPFSYPPHLGGFVALYGLLSFKAGLALHTILNLVSIFSIAYLANRWFIGIRSLTEMSLVQGVCLAFIVGNPFVAHSVYEGQWSLPAAAALFWSWHFLHNERWVLSGLFLGLATIKPQVSLLYIVWLLLTLNFRVLFIGGLLALLMLVPTVLRFGLIDMIDAWFASMRYYATQWANIPGSPHVVGLEGVFVSLGLNGSGGALKTVSAIAIVLLYLIRTSLSPLLLVHLFLVIALTFIYGHDTDFVILSVLWSYLFWLAANRNSYVSLGVAVGLLLFMFFPQRFIRAFDVPILFHTRTFILLGCCWCAYVWERQKSDRINP